MPKYTQTMWNEWKDWRLDEAPNMYKGAKKSAQKDILELQRSDLPIDMVYRSKSRKRSNNSRTVEKKKTKKT